MISTTLAVLALAGSFSPGANTALPGWQTDYAAAKAAAATQHKPMAVFIGQGAEGLKKMLDDGTIPADAAKVLRDNYVCVYLDTDAAKDVAGPFDLKAGLVINTEAGNVQAVRHGGAVSGAGLTRELTQYATAHPATTTTVATGTVVGTPATAGVTYPATVGSPMFASGGCASGNCGSPVILSGGCANGRCGTAPTYAFPTAQPFTVGGCANGRCGR